MSEIRKISNYELLCAKFGNVIVTSRIQGTLTPACLHRAFVLLLKRHTLLRACIGLKNNEYYFNDTGISSLPLTVVENTKTEEQKKDVFLQALNHSFDLAKGMFHVYYAVDCRIEEINSNSIIEISTVISHIINDGLSHLNLHKQFLEYCGAKSQEEIPDDEAIIRHPIEYYIAHFLKERQINADVILNPPRAARLEKGKKPERQIPAVIPPLTVPDQGDYLKKNVIQRTLDTPLLQALEASCSKQKVSRHSAYCAAQMKATYQQLKANHELTLICMSSVDFRRTLHMPATYLFCAASGESTFHSVSAHTPLWLLATDVGNKLKKYLKQYHYYKIPLQIQSIKPTELLPPSLDINQIPWDGVPIAVSVSDAGRIKMPVQFGQLKLLRANYCVNRYDGRLFTFITVLDEKMFINLVYQEELYCKSDMENLLDSTLQELTQAAD